MEVMQSRQKRIVDRLGFGGMTAKRVAWGDWEFTVVAPGVVAVVNAAWGPEQATHTYHVTVAPDEHDPTLFVPQECECPADDWRKAYDCKHKVALAVCGGPVVLGAAVAFTGDDDHGDVTDSKPARRVRA